MHEVAIEIIDQQMVRQVPRSARHRPQGHARRAHRRVRSLGQRASRRINRIEDWQRGRVIVDGTELTEDLKTIDEVRGEVGMVFQQFNLFPHLTVLENCTLAPIWVRKMPKTEADEIARH
jgi:ABC-type histidine transport system ATPase subunit